MENRSHAVAAGLFVVVLLALAIGLAAWLTRDAGQRRLFEISSREGVTGLQAQAGVRYKGVTVGRVQVIALDPQAQGNVLIRIAVDKAAPITRSTYASLGFQGVTGLAFIQLDDSGESDDVLTAQGDQLPRIPMRPSLMSRLSDQGAGLLTQLEQVSVRLNALLAPAHQQRLMHAVDQAALAAGDISTLTRQVQQAQVPLLAQEATGTLRALRSSALQLGQAAGQVGSSAEALRALSLRLQSPGGTLEQVAQGVDSLVATSTVLRADILPGLNPALEELTRTARQVGDLALTLQAQPQSVLWGASAAPPGPGEPGFVRPDRP